MINVGFARAYYSLRDPRDAMLSALDHAASAQAKTEKTLSDVYFARFHSRQDLCPALLSAFGTFHRWKRFGKVLFVRYEDVLAAPEQELDRIVEWLGLKADRKNVSTVVAHFAKRKAETRHFNKGVLTRYSSELNAREIREVEVHLCDCIREMNYRFSQLPNE